MYIHTKTLSEVFITLMFTLSFTVTHKHVRYTLVFIFTLEIVGVTGDITWYKT